MGAGLPHLVFIAIESFEGKKKEIALKEQVVKKRF